MDVDGDLEAGLERTLFELVSVPSFIGEERALCDAVEARLLRTLPRASVERFGDSLVARVGGKSGGPRVGLVGHLDTVRTAQDGPVRVEDGKLYGVGAADMKSGLALMLELLERVDASRLTSELWLVFYEREEGPFVENALGPMLERFDALRALDLAICLEPSDNKLQLGCSGSVHAKVTFHGRTAHSARPWQGENAILKSAGLLADLGARAPREVEVDGMVYREVISPTLASGGRGRNVVPDTFEINVNMRFAPGRTPEEAVREIEDLVAGRAEVRATDLSPAALPRASHPLVRKLADCGVRAIEPKQAWTDVARFSGLGIAAVNFGPGTQAQAHQRNEWTELALLAPGYRIVERFLTT